MNNVFIAEKVDNLFAYITVDAELKLTVFTKLQDNGCLLCVSDGCDVYTNDIFEDNLYTMAEECGFATKEDFLKNIQKCVMNKSLRLSKVTDYVVIQFENGATSFNLKCHVTTAVERKRLLKYSYITMAEDLEKCNNTINTLTNQMQEIKSTTQQDRHPTQATSIFEPDVKRQKVVKAKISKGSSLVNPGTRRKKAAAGVVFDNE